MTSARLHLWFSLYLKTVIRGPLEFQPKIGKQNTSKYAPGIIHLVRTQNFPKNYIFNLLGVRNVNFSESFAYSLNGCSRRELVFLNELK